LGYYEFKKLWLTSYVPQEMAFGVLSVLVPLYAVSALGQNLIYVGVLRAFWGLSVIVASIVFGRLCDLSGKYKHSVTLSFLFSGLSTLFLLSSENPLIFLVIYTIQAFFYVAFKPATNILIAEWNPREEWKRVMGAYTFIRALAWAGGLLIGVFAIFYLEYRGLFLFCGALSFISLALSLLLVHDPPILLERRIALLDKSINIIDYVSRLLSSSHNPDYSQYTVQGLIRLTKTGFANFLLGTFIFSLATSMFSTQLPIFFKEVFLSSSVVFGLFFLHSLAGAVARPLASGWSVVGLIKISCVVRFALAFLLIPSITLAYPYSLYASYVILCLFGAMGALFDVAGNHLSIEASPEGKTGFYFASLSLGGVVGSLISGITILYNFQTLFIAAGVLFALALLTSLKIPET